MIKLALFEDELHLALRLLKEYGVLDITFCHETQGSLKHLNTKLNCFEFAHGKKYIVKQTKPLDLRLVRHYHPKSYTKKQMRAIYKQCNLILKTEENQ